MQSRGRESLPDSALDRAVGAEWCYGASVTAGVSFQPFGPQAVAKNLVELTGTVMSPLPLATPLLFVVTVVTTPKNEHASPQSSTMYVEFGSAFLRWYSMLTVLPVR
jgi:hypothetical protein